MHHKGRVDIGADHVALMYDSEELVYWTQQEWEEDPTLVVHIAHSIRLLYEEGPEKILEMIGKREQ